MDTSSSTAVRACAFCYARKVKCIMGRDQCCRACKERGVECRPRQTQRHGRPYGRSKHTFRAIPRVEHPSPTSTSSSSRSPPDPLPPTLHIDQEYVSGQKILPAIQQIEPAFLPNDLQLGLSALKDPIYCPSPTMNHLASMEQLWSDFCIQDPVLGEVPTNVPLKMGSSLFDGYMEIDQILKQLARGSLFISMLDFNEDGAVVQKLQQIVDAIIRSAGDAYGCRDQSNVRLAILATRKACELAEYGVSTLVMMASRDRRTASTSSTYSSSSSSSSPQQTDATQFDLDPDRRAALMRLDSQLTMLKIAVGQYAGSNQGLSPSEYAAVARSQHRLLQIHTRIRGAIDSTVSEWR